MRHAAQKPLTIISNDGGDAAEAAEAVSVPEEEAADTGDHTSRLPADTAAGSDAPEDNGDGDDEEEAAAERPWQPRKRQRKELLLR